MFSLFRRVERNSSHLERAGVATEIAEDLLGSTEGPFGINHPAFPIELVAQTSEATRVGELSRTAFKSELALVVRLSETGEELRPLAEISEIV